MLLIFLIIFNLYLYSIIKGVNPIILFFILLYINCAVENNTT